ncbi:hypothetical protein HYPSUDRAFT_200683 [Hypholoma sublateritium FD-334 SS-4]|uniref:Uncharacterized protein n=1 Tax=Hypholoma sublateritium (strain FD-334 SS-4) TaxID=945553 RepID=A0A0D2NZT7_HYPSF|nr:hypothetical protein HYPSUDRAFT_200683 [Hypholoma sublateritium FD-334 SS-4]
MAQPFLEENPLTLELRTLRESVSRFQEEAHASAVKLQRYSLDSSRTHERAVHLERENDLLKAELAVLRANPHPDDGAHSSDKIESTEDALLSKTTELIHAQTETIKAKAAAEGAYELGARVRGREEAALARERGLQNRIMQLEEDARIADVALKEYAALVREMETRRSSSVTENDDDVEVVDQGTRISATVFEGKLTRSKLHDQFKAETDALQKQSQQITNELEVSKSLLGAESKVNAALVQELGNTKAALEKLHLEDSTAAKMVSRYMQFSQNSTNDLLSKLSALKARHESTLGTISSQNHALSVQLRSSEAHTNHLLRALDELGGEIMKETWGRRREVGLRIRMGGREERIVEGIRRWVRKGEEMLTRISGSDWAEEKSSAAPDASLEAFFTMAQDARILLASLDEGAFDDDLGMTLSGGKARVLLGNIALDGLLNELKDETEKRLNLQKQFATLKPEAGTNGHLSSTPTMSKVGKQEHDLPHIPIDEDILESQEDDRPPMVPEKTTTRPTIPIAPLVYDTTQPEVLCVIGENDVTNVPSTEVPDNPTHKGVGRLMDNKSVPAPISNQIIPLSSTEMSPQSTSIKLVPDHVGTLLDSEDLVSTTMNALDLPESFPEAVVGATLSSLSNTSVKSTNTPNAPPSVPTTVDGSDSVTSCSSVDLANQSPIYPESERLKTRPRDTEINMSVNFLIHDPIAPFIPPTAPEVIDDLIVDHDSPSPVPEIAAPPSITASTVDFPIASPSALTLPFPPQPLQGEPSNPTFTSPFASTSKISPKLLEQSHPLLVELIRVTKRYDDLQRAFRDCHHALEALNSGLKDSSDSHSSANTAASSPIPKDILSAALGRLDDYTEDARVELEIRVGDEALLAKGYEALLSVPGALDTVSFCAPGSEGTDGNRGMHTQVEVEKQISDFISGADPAVSRARDTFARKLDDVQHDIAALKRAIHDPESLGIAHPDATTPTSSTSTLASPSGSSGDLTPHGGSGMPSGWTSWIRSASRPASPAPPTYGHAPTFGNIMTAPRLRHAPSFGSMYIAPTPPPAQSLPRERRPSFFGLGGAASEPPASPLVALELRVPMPSFAGIGAHPSAVGGVAGAFGGAYGSVLSPTTPLMGGTMPPPARVRTVSSTLYMLGLGAAGGASGTSTGGRVARASSAGGNLTAPASPLRSAVSTQPFPRARDLSLAETPPEANSGTEEEEDTDVE